MPEAFGRLPAMAEVTGAKVAVILRGRDGDDALIEVAAHLSGGPRGVPLTVMIERPSFSEYAAVAAFLDPFAHAHEIQATQTEAARELLARMQVPVIPSFHSLTRPYLRTAIALADRLGCDFVVARKSWRWLTGRRAVRIHPVMVSGEARTQH